MSSVFESVVATLNSPLDRETEAMIVDLCAAVSNDFVILKDENSKLSVRGTLKLLVVLEEKIQAALLENALPPENTTIQQKAKDDLNQFAVRQVTGFEAKLLGLLDTPSRGEREEKLPILSCDKCSFKTKRPSHLKKHLDRHEDFSLVECDKCNFSCLRDSDLAKHILRNHGTSKQSLMCDVCDFHTQSLQKLSRHKCSSHQVPDTVKVFECKNCSYKTVKSSLMHRHVLKHNVVKSVGTSSSRQSSTKIHKCQMCTYATTKISNFSRHKLIHENVRKHLCVTCGLSFKRGDTLRQHLVTHGRWQGSSHVCNVCGRLCRSKNHLREHTATHSDVRKHLCHVCGLAFKTKVTRDRHLRTSHSSQVNLMTELKDFQDEETEEPVIYTLDLPEETQSSSGLDLQYLINESGSLTICS